MLWRTYARPCAFGLIRPPSVRRGFARTRSVNGDYNGVKRIGGELRAVSSFGLATDLVHPTCGLRAFATNRSLHCKLGHVAIR